MTRELEDALRQTVQELADEGRPVNLADRAAHQGRRLIRRRRAATALASVAAFAALAVPFAVAVQRHAAPEQVGTGPLRSTPGASVPATAAPASPSEPAVPSEATQKPFVRSTAVVPENAFNGPMIALHGKFGLVAAPVSDGTMVYDATHGKYSLIRMHGVSPRPGGDLLAMVESGKLTLLELPSGKRTTVKGPVPVTRVQWSPDGTRLVYGADGGSEGTLRLAIVDATSATAWTIGGDLVCVEYCSPAWSADGREITLAVAGDGNGVQVYSSIDGAPTALLDRLGPIPSANSWAPDGSMVAVHRGSGTSIVHVKTRKTMLDLDAHAAGIFWVDNGIFLSVQGTRIIRYDLVRRTEQEIVLPRRVIEDEVYSTVIGPNPLK